MKKKGELVRCLVNELRLRKEGIADTVETIYFGGGTPSLLSEKELEYVFEAIYEHFTVSNDAEITLEANPDDLSEEKIKQLANSPVNRLSIGVQSFFEEDLKLMHRAHNAQEALASIRNAQKYFENISIDLIYGIPEMPLDRWKKNLEWAFQLEVPHLSCYALTVEPKTALESFIKKGLVPPVDEEMSKAHYELLLDETAYWGLVNYEFSNFGKPGFESQNNLAYWLGKPYMGVGPSAHSYDGLSRTWNVSNNSRYIKALETNVLPQEREVLSQRDRYNEYVMTRLRTQWGIQLEEVEGSFGTLFKTYLLDQAASHLNAGRLVLHENALTVSRKGKFLSDGIASDLFLLPLESKEPLD